MAGAHRQYYVKVWLSMYVLGPSRPVTLHFCQHSPLRERIVPSVHQPAVLLLRWSRAPLAQNVVLDPRLLSPVRAICRT